MCVILKCLCNCKEIVLQVITLKINRYGKDFFFLWKPVFGLCLNKNWSKLWQGKTSDCCFLRQKKVVI